MPGSEFTEVQYDDSIVRPLVVVLGEGGRGWEDAATFSWCLMCFCFFSFFLCRQGGHYNRTQDYFHWILKLTAVWMDIAWRIWH